MLVTWYHCMPKQPYRLYGICQFLAYLPIVTFTRNLNTKLLMVNFRVLIIIVWPVIFCNQNLERTRALRNNNVADSADHLINERRIRCRLSLLFSINSARYSQSNCHVSFLRFTPCSFFL